MFFRSGCHKCGGDVLLDSYRNEEDGSYDLFCFQCGNRDFPKASTLATIYKKLEEMKKPSEKKLYSVV